MPKHRILGLPGRKHGKLSRNLPPPRNSLLFCHFSPIFPGGSNSSFPAIFYLFGSSPKVWLSARPTDMRCWKEIYRAEHNLARKLRETRGAGGFRLRTTRVARLKPRRLFVSSWRFRGLSGFRNANAKRRVFWTQAT